MPLCPQIAAEQVLNFLHANPSYGPLMVHGLSVGAYLFMEVMGKVSHEAAAAVDDINDSDDVLSGLRVHISGLVLIWFVYTLPLTLFVFPKLMSAA